MAARAIKIQRSRGRYFSIPDSLQNK